MLILAADIGGTNSRFGLIRLGTGRMGQPIVQLAGRVRLSTPDFPDLPAMLEHLRHNDPAIGNVPVDAAAFALAGPIERGGTFSNPPNIAWSVDLADIRPLLQADHVFLLNDFVAQAEACTLPDLLNMQTIRTGRAVPAAPCAVVGAGTGLGKCLLLPGGGTLPSEGGHGVFPFSGAEEYRFAEFVESYTNQQLEGDTILSGSGLRFLYAFHTGEWLEPAEAASRLHAAHPVEAWFARFYGRACRNYILDTLALGGLYISGGVAAKNPNLLTNPAFLAGLDNCPANRPLLEQVPVYLVSNPDAALYGAALYAFRRSMQ